MGILWREALTFLYVNVIVVYSKMKTIYDREVRGYVGSEGRIS